MDDLKVELKIEDRESKIYIDGKLADEEELQSKASSLAVSIIGGIADNTKLFEFSRNLIDELKKENNVIVSGRALMEIYPKLDYHLFVTTSNILFGLKIMFINAHARILLFISIHNLSSPQPPWTHELCLLFSFQLISYLVILCTIKQFSLGVTDLIVEMSF